MQIVAAILKTANVQNNMKKIYSSNLNKNKLLRSLNKLYYELEIEAWSYKLVGIPSSGLKE